MKQKLFVLCMAAILIISCNLPLSATPIPLTETPIVLPTNTTSAGSNVTLNNVSFSIPLGVAQGADSEVVPAASGIEAGPWSIAPDHLRFQLTGYQLQGKFSEPQISVYPTDEYAQMYPTAAEQIQRLKDILAGTEITKDVTPGVPFYNAGQLFAAQLQRIDFKGGRGVRFLTQYDQYPAPINNREMFYHFQGLTNDGKYYVIAILPVTSSILAEDEKPESPVPAGGVPIPAQTGPDQGYYEAVTKALDAMYPDSFNPSLFQLDALIQSITVTP